MKKYLLFISFLFGCQGVKPITTVQKPESPDTIIKKIKERAFDNYGNSYISDIDFKEYIFFAEKKKIVRTVQIKGMEQKGGITLNKSHFIPTKSYVQKGRIYYDQVSRIGLSHPMEEELPGNSFSTLETNEIATMLFYDHILEEFGKINSLLICAGGHKVINFKDNLLYERSIVRDTIIAEKEYFVVNTNIASEYNWEENLYDDEFKGLENWKQFVLIKNKIYLVNKADYALVDFKYNRIYKSKITKEERYFYRTSSYTKIGDFYYEDYYASISPQYTKDVCGFNLEGIYNLMIKAQKITPGHSSQIPPDAIEIQNVPFERFCNPVDSLTSDLILEWERFWKENRFNKI